ncbi:MAG: hypothetical protein Kow0080_33310 [Candidatus Promineifilaceae bacterium]
MADAPEFEMWLLHQRENIRLEILTTLETLIHRHQTNGQTQTAIACARQLLTIEPWREAAHQQLMYLLACTGEYTAALRQYQQCRQMLAEELSVDPMPETETLRQRIAALRQNPPARQLAAPPLIGREAELSQLAVLLTDPACRLVAITGMGGMGKTTLAQAFAARQATAWLDGVAFVSLAELETAELLETAVAEALHLSLHPSPSPRQQLVDTLRPKEMLLILDNAEHLLTAVTDLAHTLLTAAPNVKILLTSREMPRLRTAHNLPLDGLPLSNNETFSTAEQLFTQQAQRIQPQFDPQQERPSIAAICHLLQGSPLGIELAAAQMDRESCAQLAARLEETLAHLAADFQDMPPRHRSLQALFNHTWALLSPDEQAKLARLTIFRGGFTAAAAAVVADVELPTLRRFQAKSLLHAQNGRFSLHDLIRRFAHNHLLPETAVDAQHAHYFSQQLQTAPPPHLLPEGSNIRAMWQYALTQADATLLAETGHALARFYVITNQFFEGRMLFNQAIEQLSKTAISQTAPVVWGELLGRYAMFLFYTGSLPEAQETAVQSVTALRGHDAPKALAFSLNLLGTLHIQIGHFPEAISLLEECASLYRQLAHPELLIKPLINLGSVYMRQGQYAAAIRQLKEAQPLAEKMGDKRGLAHIHNNLGASYLILNDLVAAEQHLTACLALTTETAYQPVRMMALQNLGEMYLKQGDWARATAVCTEGVATAKEIGDKAQLPRIQKVWALARHAAGERMLARQLLAQAVTMAYEARAFPALLDVLTGMGTLLLADGETAVAATVLRCVAAHPATEQQHVAEAKTLLAQAGEAEEKERPLAEVVTAVLALLEH